MTTTTSETLRAKVYASIYPDGPKLEFGVEVIHPDWGICKVISKCDCEEEEIELQYSDSCLHTNHFRKENLKILGPPLQLSHLLRAIQEKHEFVIIQVNRGNLDLMGLNESSHQGAVRFDLTKPISEQSEDTLKKLIELV